MYEQIADRYLDAGGHLQDNIHEASLFASYHSFESIACAWLRHIGQQAHPLPHPEKIRRFILNSRNYRFNRQAATIGGVLQAMRNTFLYPTSDGRGGYQSPENKYSNANARQLLRDVGRVVGLVKREL
jgi:hypothetical protein